MGMYQSVPSALPAAVLSRITAWYCFDGHHNRLWATNVIKITIKMRLSSIVIDTEPLRRKWSLCKKHQNASPQELLYIFSIFTIFADFELTGFSSALVQWVGSVINGYDFQIASKPRHASCHLSS